MNHIDTQPPELGAPELGEPVPTTPGPRRSAQFKSIVRAADMIFLAATVLTLALVAAFWALFSFSHALGALLGGAMVVVDVLIFRRYVAKVKPGPQASPLWKVVVKFYLVSFANIIFCFLVIKFGIGAPLAFLAGLGVFLPALIVGLILNAVTLKLKSGDIVAGEEPAAGYTAGGAGEAPVASDGAGDGAAIGKSVGHGG